VGFERKLKTAEEIKGLAKQFMKPFLYFRVHQEKKKL